MRILMDYERIIAKRLDDFYVFSKKKWAIYGTGKGGEIVYRYFTTNKAEDIVYAFIDNDTAVDSIKSFCGKKVIRLCEAYDKCDGIIIAAMNNHAIVADRISNFLSKDSNGEGVIIIDVFNYFSNAEIREYLSYIEEKVLKKSDCFIEESSLSFALKEGDPNIIAWYLPQFHQIEINNKLYGKGFTEWTNTTQTIPLFTGHWQPHIPYDVGYYELNNTEIFKRQIELAQKYGLYGFSFYYYWFSGEKIMEKPVDMYLEDKSLDFPFCLTWANENWTALWDGGDKEIIYEQKLREEDDSSIIKDLIRYMKDERYICKDGKPMLIVYRVAIFGKERTQTLFSNFRKIAKENGFDDLYIVVCNAHGFEEEPEEWGADALVEFPPHIICNKVKNVKPEGYINPYFNGKVKDMSGFISNKEYLYEHNTKAYYRGVMTSWDNTARKATTGATIYTGLNPQSFKIWLRDAIVEGKDKNGKNNYVFVNSWNEWAEGSHLEPDMKYGYGFLQSMKEAIEESRELKTSYAQDKEDVILYAMLHNVEKGRYIDVGANDPDDISVTKLFYNIGWSGVNIEPLKSAYDRLQEMRTRDINLNIGLGAKRGKAILHCCGSGSTMDEGVVEMLGYEDIPAVEVEINTLSNIYDEYCDFKDIHFCKIDVEGFEKEVLLGVENWIVFRPWVFCMESVLPASSIPCHEKWEHILLENGYELAFAYGINRYYVDKGRKGDLDLERIDARI